MDFKEMWKKYPGSMKELDTKYSDLKLVLNQKQDQLDRYIEAYHKEEKNNRVLLQAINQVLSDEDRDKIAAYVIRKTHSLASDIRCP